MKILFRAIPGCLLLLTTMCFGQDSSTAKKYPTVVLVQLRSEQNRIAALKKAGKYADVATVENDAMQVNNKIKLDFNNNFDYCPVFYFVDTNADLVKSKRFDGVLFDANGTPVNGIIAPGDSNYVIAYYGYAVSQAKYHKVQKDDVHHLNLDEINELQSHTAPALQTNTLTVADHDPPSGKGLVILNDKFRQLTYFYKLGYDEIFFARKKKKLKGYYYKSKRFDIEYYPFAGLFNETLLDRYGRRRITSSSRKIKG